MRQRDDKPLGDSEAEAPAESLTEARFRDFLETSADWFWETDLEQRFTYYSVERLPLLGERPLGKTRRELLRRRQVEPADLPEIVAAHMARGEAFRDMEYRVLGPQGTPIWMRISGKPAYDSAGRIIGYRGSARNISERRERELALSDRQAHYESIFANAVEGMYRTALDGSYLEVNPALARMHGCESVEEFLAVFPKSPPIYADPQDRQRMLQLAIERGYLRGFECVALRRDGSRFLMSETCWPARDSRGGIVGLEGLVEDITERKHAEQALEQARIEALEASRAKSDFLAHVSHELRTPLNAVIGYSEAMMEQLFGPLGSPRYEEYCQHIRESGHHLLALINDILDLSKVEAGEFPLHPSPLNLVEVACAAIDLVQRLSQEQGVPVSLTGAEKPLPLYGDERAVKQILVNLLSNAIKFTRPPGRVWLSLTPEADGARMVVEDQGVGMTAEEVEVAMLPFRQVESPLSRRIEGTGLGLPLVRAITEAHGGRVTIDSRPGCGTRVEVRLPNLASSGSFRSP